MSQSPAAVAGFTVAEARQARRLGLVLGLTTVFVGLEFAGAVLARSQVLLADAVHLLLDVVALALSIAAMRLAVRAPSARFTFGLRRVEPLMAVLNGLLVLGAAALIGYESTADLRATVPPRPTLMLVVAGAALVVHGLSAWLLHDAIAHREPSAAHDHDHASHDHDHQAKGSHATRHHHGHALNLRGVWLHLVGDTLGAIAALVAAVVIRAGGPAIVDPLGGVLVALILVAGAVKLLRDATWVLLDATPLHLPVDAVREVVMHDPAVAAVQQLRVWTLGAGHDAVSVDVAVRVFDEGLAGRLRDRLRHELGVEFVTVEVSVRSTAPSRS